MKKLRANYPEPEPAFSVVWIFFIHLYFSPILRANEWHPGFSPFKKEHPIDTSYHHHVLRAALFSAIIPGAGQIYNEYGYNRYSKKRHRAWWKVPIIYGGLITSGYFLKSFVDTTNMIRKEYHYKELNPSGYWYSEYQYYNLTSLTAEYDRIAKKRDRFILISIGVYALGVIEALVDAHFVTFDVSDKLTFDWHPVFFDRSTAGLGISLTFR